MRIETKYPCCGERKIVAGNPDVKGFFRERCPFCKVKVWNYLENGTLQLWTEKEFTKDYIIDEKNHCINCK